MNIVGKNKCTGCKACQDICPTDAISFSVDKEGFWYYKINEKLCINCNKCIITCPETNKYQSDMEEPKIYAAWSKDNKRRLNSTSGGLFYSFAKLFLENGGYIVGCQYSKNYKSAYHTIISDKKDLDKLMGSKYFQSDTEGIYKQTKELLENGKKVFFTGAPCQVAALYKFLNKKYSNLLTMDFICLGINSPRAFSCYVEEQEKKHKSKVSYVQLKNKIKGWNSLATYMEFENGTRYLADKDKDSWIRGYIKEFLYIRPSCYTCQYKGTPRVSDISVGDFWGIKNVSKGNIYKGVSAVLLNSEKGKEYFLSIQSIIEYRESTYDDLKKGNPALEETAKISKGRKVFFDYLDKYPFSKAIRKSCSDKKQFNLNLYENIFKIKKENPIEFLKDSNLLDSIDISKFFYFNYFCKCIERDDNVYLIPYKNSIIDLDPSSKIIIKKKNIEVGINKLQKSKSETHLRLGKNAKWISKRGAGIFYNVIIEVCDNATFESGFFTVNGGSVIVCAKHILFGENVMMGRNIIVYDSDHHQILDENNQIKNNPKEVIIGDNVWLTSNVTVLKGVNIGSGSIIGAQTLVTKSLEKNAFFVGGNTAKLLGKNAKWSRKRVF